MVNELLQSVGLTHVNEAIRGCSRRVADLRESLGPYHPDYATALNQLSLLLIMQGEADSAESFLREALEIRRVALGEAHPDYATNLSSLGGILWARGELEEAEPILRKASEIRNQILGADHPKAITSRHSLEQLIQARKTWEEECLHRMQRARLGAANETSSVPTATTAVLDAPPPVPPHRNETTESDRNPQPVAAASAPPATETVTVTNGSRRGPSPFPTVSEATLDDLVASRLDQTDRVFQGLRDAAPASAPIPVPIPTPTPPPVLAPPAAEASANHQEVAKPIEPTGVREPHPTADERADPELSNLTDELTSSFSDLAAAFNMAARRLVSVGECPSTELLEDSRTARACFLEIEATLQDELKHHEIAGHQEPLTDLDGMKRRIKVVEESREKKSAQRKRRFVALQVLREINHLTCPSDPQFPPLQDCRSQVDALTRAIQLGQNLGPSLTSIVEGLANGSHPFSSVVKFAQADRSMNDHDWSVLYQAVSSTLGTPLAVALARGRIVAN